RHALGAAAKIKLEETRERLAVAIRGPMALRSTPMAARPAAGRIVFTSPIVESGGDYRVFAEVENRQIEGTQQWLLRAGQTATLVIHSKEPPLPAVRK
ncbi:MAG: hypothetical protein WCJ18_06930, partial [Planctomycetota bacterium]